MALSRKAGAALAAIALAGAASAWWTLAPARVEVQRPTLGPAVRAVYATGTVEPLVMLPIAPRIAGRLIELRVDEGARITRNQILARLEDTDLERTVEELEARARFAKEDFQRARILHERRLGSAVDRDRAEAEWKAAEAAAARARAQQEFMWLRAPDDGLILRRDGEVGQLIPSGQPVFYMSCCDDLRVTAEVDEEDIALVDPGQRTLIRADAFPGQVFEGKVFEITPMGDPITRTYRVRIPIEGRTPLRIGMTTDANIIVEQRNDAMLVPASAVADGHVWIVRDGRLRKRSIEVGISGGLKVEVRSGLALDEEVVTLPRADFEDGDRVRPKLAEGAERPEE